MSDHAIGIIPDMSHEQYLAASGVSHSMLKILREKSPLHLKSAIEQPEKVTEAKRIGSLTHRCLLLPDTMAGAFYVSPEGMDFRTKEGRAWKAEHADRPIVTDKHMKAVEGMVASVHRHPVVKRMMATATFEQSIFVEDSRGTLRKLRPDIMPAGNVLPDLKTCMSAHPDDFTRTVGEYGYFSQGAWYLDGTKLVGREYDMFVIIAVEKEPPYAVATYTVDPVVIDYGRTLNSAALERYRQCLETETWPGFDERLTYIGLPKWMQHEAEQLA